MEPGIIDSIDKVIADVTAQPIASKSTESLQRLSDINLSASNITIVPRPASNPVQPSTTALHFGSMSLLNPQTLSLNIASVEISLPHGQPAETKEAKEPREIKEYNDEQIIIEALRSAKDRLFMLKLGDSMENLIAERQVRSRAELPPPSSSYHRLLVHRTAAYYKLVPETDPVTKIITVCIGPESRTPARRLLDLVPLETPTIAPSFQIMRRTPNGRSARSSTAGDDTGTPGELSDVDASETGSSRSNLKKHLTISQREAAYNEARSRIFMGFQGKTSSLSDKPHSASASSSNLSAESSSAASAGGGSSTGELDDGASTAPTESDRSYPPGHSGASEKRSNRGQGSKKSGSTSGSHQRRNRRVTLDQRENYEYNRGLNMDSPVEQPEYHPPGPGVDPATGLFLPSLYNSSQSQSQTNQPPEIGYQDPNVPPQGYGSGALYPMYTYAPPYIAPYAYYPYPYPPPPHATQSQNYVEGQRYGAPSEQQCPVQQPPPPESYPPVAYVPVWGPPLPMQQGLPNASQPAPRPGQPQIPQNSQEYPPQPQPPPQLHQSYHYPPPPSNFQSPPGVGQGIANPPFHQHREPPVQIGHVPDIERVPYLHGDSNSQRYSWNSASSAGHKSQSMGPRSNGTKKAASNKGARASGDNVSIASSSSSSSRLTPGSTTSHPLPPRPDWAVGLMPQGGNHGSMSNSHTQLRPPGVDPPQPQHASHRIPQQGADPGEFPPLSPPHPPANSSYSPHTPNIWNDGGQGFQASNYTSSPGSTFSSSSFMQNPGIQGAMRRDPMNDASSVYPFHLQMTHSSSYSSSTSSNNRARLDEPDRRFERPRPRGNVELFNPKARKAASSQSGGQSQSSEQNSDSGSNRQRGVSSSKLSSDAERRRGEAVRNAILVEKIENLSLGDHEGC